MKQAEMPVNRYVGWFSTAPLRILVSGVILALLVASAVMVWLMQPPLADLTTLISTLAVTAAVSLAAGFLLYRRGLARSPSLALTLTLAYALAALLMLVNVLVMAQQMFFNQHDLALSIVLLLFGINPQIAVKSMCILNPSLDGNSIPVFSSLMIGSPEISSTITTPCSFSFTSVWIVECLYPISTISMFCSLPFTG